jgi:hypothetical protein
VCCPFGNEAARAIRLSVINNSFHIGNNIWSGSAGDSGIDCQPPPEVSTQVGIDYLAWVEAKVLIGATTFVFVRRAAAFGKR